MNPHLYWILAASLVCAAAIAWSCTHRGSESDKQLGVE
ncbi:hypothetical protein SAMN05443245_5199 [Paraburkholderia fungorum]|uniref:Uncharacterized protein n=1 Tax=Paraburkholderia fungorum TaxID=134537 RepID=A0A1H1IHP9_9BURK|nr:hypothetical protein SAMN05443245_5199 [Paraburkholderia fungorum]